MNRLPERARAHMLGTAIAALLKRSGFELFIPTQTFSDALHPHDVEHGRRYPFDCDTGAFIYMSIAEHFEMPARLVEIRLSADTSHNYVRWTFSDGGVLDWDANGQTECKTPADHPEYLGTAMTTDETLGYVYTLRGLDLREKGRVQAAVEDYRRSAKLRPLHPGPLNNLAWAIATAPSLQTDILKIEALTAALKAVSIERDPNYLDTLACVHAVMGDFNEAVKIESEAFESGRSEDFRRRIEDFRHKKTCLGAK
jgi:tetratricopeptide (TPR) repeat protein